jgi:hypothetical protein
MANIFTSRLNFNFDKTKFGDAIVLSQDTKDFLNTKPIVLTDWQISDLANSNVATSGNYYKNPVLNVSNQLRANVYNLKNVFLRIDQYDNMVQSANIISVAANLIIQIDAFKSHTDNISGIQSADATVTEDTYSSVEFPDYDKSIALGKDLVMLLNATDGILDASPALGSMTSLFIESDIRANNNTIFTYIATANNTIRSGTIYVGDPPAPATGNISNISQAVANSILESLNVANTLIAGRRESDWFYYREGLELLQDYDKVTRLEDVGQTQEYLIKNLVGTQEYIDKISANT